MGLAVGIIVGLVVIVAVILIVIGLRSPDQSDPLQERLADFVERGENVSLEEIELSQPFVERVIYPLARNLGELALRFTPQNAIQQVARKLDMAGNPGNIDPALFFAFRFFGIPLGAITLLLGRILPPGNLFEERGLWIAIPASIFGFYLPDLLIKSRIDRRQDSVRKAMPDALDLLTICVEAGLGFEGVRLVALYERYSWVN
jgi:tight adherence protein C